MVDPAAATLAFVEAAREAGAKVHTGTRVSQVALRGGKLDGLVTDAGQVACDAVVLASGQRLAVPDTRTWALLAVTIVLGGAGHLMMNWAHAYTPLMLTSLLTLAGPVISVAAAAAFLGEPIFGAQVAGIAVVLGSLGFVVARATATDQRTQVLDGLEDLV